ncbi:MAG: hypothetical protein LBT80_04070 [Lactobacillaceae bacterium]|nr:hypothetical protein [Lactobacillaceae bacterium]
MKKFFAKCMTVVMLLNLFARVAIVPTVSASSKSEDLAAKVLDKTGTILGNFFKEDNKGVKTRSFNFLGYVGIAMDIFNMFMPTAPDPVMEKLKSMDSKLDNMADQINNQAADLFEHQDKASYVSALSNVNKDVNQLTDNRQADLNKFYSAMQIVKQDNAQNDNTHIIEYMPSIATAMHKIYDAEDQTAYLNAFRDFAKDISGEGGIFGQDDICKIYDNWMHTTVDWNALSFDGREAFYTATSNTLNYTYGILTVAVNYDLETKEAKYEIYNDQLAEWDKLTGEERAEVDDEYKKTDNEAWELHEDINSDKQLLADDENATINNSIVKGREIAQAKINAARERLDAEKAEVTAGQVRAYRLSDRKVRKNIIAVWGPRLAADETGYKIKSFETYIQPYTAEQQNTVDHKLGQADLAALKTAADRRGTNLYKELQDAGFTGKDCANRTNPIANNGNAIWSGEARQDVKATWKFWVRSGETDVYLKTVNRANPSTIIEDQVIKYTRKAANGNEYSQVNSPNPLVLAWAG